ncbi:MAG: aspartyl protease family protein [Saprospiraceae bacterium]
MSCSTDLIGQAFGYSFKKEGKKQVKLKFERINNLIILPFIMNDSTEVKFIVDTGVRHTLITKKSYLDSLNLNYGKKYRLMGANKESFVDAQLVYGLNYDFGPVQAVMQTALVLDEDYFDLDNSLGVSIDGILGMDLFMRYVVKVDYELNMITLIEPNKFKPPSSYQSLDLELIQGKPYINVATQLDNGQLLTSTLLVDCGASLSLMLDMNSDKRIVLPEKHIHGTFGQVLGGNLEAYVGRVNLLAFSSYNFNNVVTNFQMPFWIDTLSNSNGLMGGGILSRFDVVYDCVHHKMYLRKNQHYDEPFTQDRSGLHIELQGNSFNQFIIADVIQDSPADIAGIQTGDLILKCNGKPIQRLSLDYINNTLQSESETIVRLTLLRNNEEVDVKFKLKDLI